MSELQIHKLNNFKYVWVWSLTKALVAEFEKMPAGLKMW